MYSRMSSRCLFIDWRASLLLPEWSNFDTYLKLTVHSHILNGIYHLCLNHNYHIQLKPLFNQYYG